MTSYIIATNKGTYFYDIHVPFFVCLLRSMIDTEGPCLRHVDVDVVGVVVFRFVTLLAPNR